jgi:hypothetical protein
MSNTAGSGRSTRRRFQSHSDVDPRAYDRARDLPKLLPLWPLEIVTSKIADHAGLLARLRKALRAERQRGVNGHWTYDLARHAQLLRAYRAEATAYLRATARSRRRAYEDRPISKERTGPTSP